MIDVKKLKEKIDIKEVISQYADLKKSGDSYKAKCPHPAHRDKTPSFYVKPKEGYFKCFGCSDFKGDVINFIEEIEGVDFKEAINMLMESEDIDYEETQVTKRVIKEELTAEKVNKAINRYNSEYYINEEILESYQDIIPKYFIERRFDEETLKYFEVKFCTDQSSELYNRAVYPYRNESGKIVAIEGRDVSGVSDKKYMVKSGSKKHNTLYNIHNQNYNQEFLILVEGVSDVWRLHQFGFPQGVALGGDDLGDRKWLLRKYADKVILMLDNDEAGMRARKKIANELYCLMDVYGVNLGVYEDPAEIFDKEDMERIIANRVPFRKG